LFLGKYISLVGLYLAHFSMQQFSRGFHGLCHLAIALQKWKAKQQGGSLLESAKN
jgi:hypothetical protein